MKKMIAIAIAASMLAAGGAAVAKPMGPKAQVVEKDAKGHPTKVSIDGQVYPVCTKTVTDGCINPRQAGLNWGNAPLGHWPGEPASQKDPGH